MINTFIAGLGNQITFLYLYLVFGLVISGILYLS